MLNKKCSHCKEIKPTSEFFKDKSNKDGLYDNCKSCHSAYTIAYGKTEKAIKRRNKYVSKFFSTPEGKLKRNKIQRDYRKKNPEKYRARQVIHNAVQRGKMPRVSTLFCKECGKKAESYHHYKGYEFKYDVIPLCKKCHFSIHNCISHQENYL